VARLLSSLASYTYTAADDGSLYTHLYIGGDFTHEVNGKPVLIHTDTHYPWEGSVSITLSPQAPLTFTCALRVPGWCSRFTVNDSGTPVTGSEAAPVENGYIKLHREWKPGDTITLNFDMPVTLNRANPAVREDVGKVAVSRGPLVYCLEEADNGPRLHLISLSAAPQFSVEHRCELLGGVSVITGEGETLSADWPEPGLYAPEREAASPAKTKKRLTWIPYYAWANRGLGEMLVWLRK
jgi:DUF1680 family protein